MIVRQDQFRAFENAAVDNFVRELGDHCREFSPDLCNTLKPEELDEAIRYGIGQAQKHGFDQRGPVRLYVDLTIVLGSGFDTDPQYPWVAEFLNPKEEVDQMERSMKLHSRAATYLDAVNGPDNVHSLRALADLECLLRQGLDFRPETLDNDAMRLMASVHPRKLSETGPPPFKLLIAEARARAAEPYGFRKTRSLALVMILMFAFGHRFDADPFFPWIRRTLERRDPADPEAAAAKLERRAVLWLQAVLKNAEVKN
jgi:hypothetical protein